MPVGEVFYGERLQLAREFQSLTQKALGLEVTASHGLISQYENGQKKTPPSDLVEAFGSVLGFTREFFYRPLDDVFRENECNFRHRRTAPRRLKTQVRAHGTLLGMVIHHLRTQFRFPQLNVPEVRAITDEEIEAAAEKSRNHWNLNIEAPLLHAGRVLENAGVLIFSQLLHSAKIDAFSRQGPTTVIFLNKEIPSTSRWIFDIGHECGHLVMHSGTQTGSVETEQAADRFAGAFLLPHRAFAREFRSARFSWGHVFELKQHWRVSAAAIVRRAYQLGLIGAVDYRRAFQYMSFKGWRTKGEPYEPTFQEPELLSGALERLGSDVDLTIDQLCRDLNFRPKIFQDVTGVAVPVKPQKPIAVIPLRAG